MTLDDELRHALTDRAGRMDYPDDPIAGIERRARRMKRNRLAAGAAALAVVVGGVAVAVPVLTDSDDRPEQILATDPTEPVPTTGPDTAPVPGELPYFGTQGRLDPTQPWDYRGTTLSQDQRGTFAQAWQDRYPEATFVPLFGQVWEPSGQLEVVFLARNTGQGDLWGVMQASPDGPDVPWVQPLREGTTGLAAALPGDEGVTRLLLVTSPEASVQSYLPENVPGEKDLDIGLRTAESLASLAPGVGTLAMEGDQARDLVQAYLPNTDPLEGPGELVYRDSAPDLPTGSDLPGDPDLPSDPGLPSDPDLPTTPNAEPPAPPSNVVDWPLRGDSSDLDFVSQAQRAFAEGLGVDPSQLGFRPLLGLTTDGGLRLLAGQAWTSDSGPAATVFYSTGGECGPEVFLGAPAAEDAGVLAFLVGCQPGRTTDSVFVVSQPQTGQIEYAVDATTAYQPLEPLPGLEPTTEIDRDPRATTDRLRVLDGDGDLDNPVYEGPLADLLCGLTECG